MQLPCLIEEHNNHFRLYHLRLRVECTLFVIYKAGCEPMPHLVIGLNELLGDPTT
jgi:hypothetical protein